MIREISSLFLSSVNHLNESLKDDIVSPAANKSANEALYEDAIRRK